MRCLLVLPLLAMSGLGQDVARYASEFQADFPNDQQTTIPDAEAAEWMRRNVPLFTCPDRDVERAWYYRWWSYRKHIEQTPQGYVVTEFLRPVKHAGPYNTISCALGHHLAEGRWLRDPRYLDGDVHFWLETGQKHYHQYSGWTAWGVYQRWLADGRTAELTSLLDSLVKDFEQWVADRQTQGGLFWQYDVRDGMEESASGSRKNRNLRPTINSYMYGNALAIAQVARRAGRVELAKEYEARAARLRALVQEELWNQEAQFFEARLDTGKLAGVREEIGFTPWYFELPEKGRGFEAAWKQLMDPQGFYAPYGPTTAEQRHPAYGIRAEGDNCQWNGPSWPFSTSITLTALANVLNDYPQKAVSVDDYFRTFLLYTRSQKLRLADGRVVPFIDENLHPHTGEWWARAMAMKKGKFYARGDHYNHSTYNDLIVTGVVGLRPRADEVVEVNPLIPPGRWDWFRLENLPYHGRTLTIVWDRDGRKFGGARGLRILADGREIARSAKLGRLTGRLRP